jgi:hypothetical protein
MRYRHYRKPVTSSSTRSENTVRLPLILTLSSYSSFFSL